MTLYNQKLPILFDHKTQALFCGDDLQEAMLLKADGKPMQQVKVIFLYGRYPAVSIGGKKIHIHRLLGEYYACRELFPCEIVHHINGNCCDARRGNLKIMWAGEHATLHLTGRKLTPAQCQVIAERNRSREGIPRKKKLNIPRRAIEQLRSDGLSINAIAKHFGCDWSSIKSRTTDNPELLEKQANE